MVKKTWAKLGYISNPHDQLKWAKGLHPRCVKDTPSSIETLPWSIHFCPVQSIHVIFVHPQWFENPSPGKTRMSSEKGPFPKSKVEKIVFHSHHFSGDIIFEGVIFQKFTQNKHGRWKLGILYPTSPIEGVLPGVCFKWDISVLRRGCEKWSFKAWKIDIYDLSKMCWSKPGDTKQNKHTNKKNITQTKTKIKNQTTSKQIPHWLFRFQFPNHFFVFPSHKNPRSLVNCCTCFGAEPPGFVVVRFLGAKLRSPGLKGLPSRELTYPTWGKGKSSLNTPYQGDILISWRVIFSEFSNVFYQEILGWLLRVLRINGLLKTPIEV